jgi:hypothetical protein
MTGILLLPPIVGLLVLGAHFLRRGALIGVVAALVGVLLLAVPRAWAARLVQVALVLGAAEWVRTLVGIARWRTAHGEPTTRLVLILGGVAVFTLASAAVFLAPRLRARYGLGGGLARSGERAP